MLLLLCVVLVNENYHYADPHKMAAVICLHLCLHLPANSRILSSAEANHLVLSKQAELFNGCCSDTDQYLTKTGTTCTVGLLGAEPSWCH